MSDKFFGELLRQYEIMEAGTAPTVTQRRQDMQQARAPQPQAKQPGFFGRMKNFAGAEANRASNAISTGAGKAWDSTVNTVAGAAGSGRYNPINRTSQWLGDKMGQWGKSTPQLDGRIAQQNQINQNKYRASDQYTKDTTDIYKRDQQKAVQKYDELIKQNNAKLNAPTAPTPTPTQAPTQTQAPAPVARPQVPMAASVAPQAPVQAPAPVPTYRPQVNAAAQEVERLRAAARAKQAAMAAQQR
jgi:hypothetical protein